MSYVTAMTHWLKRSAGLLAGLGVMCAAAAGPAGSSSEQKVVVELFTSQGCSSCPKADDLLRKLSRRPEIVALTFPVHYWDYLGWRDTLASHANTERQRHYARARGDGMIYTPQLVVQGLVHVNGGDEKAIEAAIATTMAARAGNDVPVLMYKQNGEVVVEVGGAPEGAKDRSATVWLAIAKKLERVHVTRGENRGRLLTYTNPVRELTPIGMWKGEPMTLRLPLKEIKIMGGECLFVLLQVEDAGPILGAAQMSRL